MKLSCSLCMALMFALLALPALADEQQAKPTADAKAATQKLYEQFTETMNGVKLVGRFTVLGNEDNSLREEEYTIKSVSKLPDGDYWNFDTHIKYGKYDVPVTLKLEVKWSGDTPVITLTDYTIPAMGTFSSRVVIYNNKYAGTWTHGKAGGHLFGRIVKIKAE